RQPKVDNFRDQSASVLQAHHDVAWFDVPMDEVLFVHRSQTGRDLRHDFERQLYLQPPGAFDEAFKRFSLHKLHRVEVVCAAFAQMEHGGNIWVTDARRCARLAQKPKPRRFITEILFADDLQRHWASEIDVEGFVSDPHSPATQLDRSTVFA